MDSIVGFGGRLQRLAKAVGIGIDANRDMSKPLSHCTGQVLCEDGIEKAQSCATPWLESADA